MLVLLLIAGGVFFLDLATKAWIIASIEPGQSVPLIPGVFHLTRVHNPGVAFGLGAPTLAPLFMATSILALAFFIYYGLTWGRTSRWAMATMALLSGGVAGNLADRLRFGYVVDFLDFRVWPVFNVADSALTVGAILLAVLVWREGFG